MGIKAWRVTFLDGAGQTLGTSELFTTNPQAAMTKTYALAPASLLDRIHTVKIERTDMRSSSLPVSLNEF